MVQEFVKFQHPQCIINPTILWLQNVQLPLLSHNNPLKQMMEFCTGLVLLWGIHLFHSFPRYLVAPTVLYIRFQVTAKLSFGTISIFIPSLGTGNMYNERYSGHGATLHLQRTNQISWSYTSSRGSHSQLLCISFQTCDIVSQYDRTRTSKSLQRLAGRLIFIPIESLTDY